MVHRTGGVLLHTQRANVVFAVVVHLQRNGKERIVLCRKAEILARKVLFHAVGKAAVLHLCGSFAERPPHVCVINCFAVHLHPVADGSQHRGVLIGDGSVRFRAYV